MLFGAIGNGEKANMNPQVIKAEQKLREIENQIETTKSWINDKENELKQELSTLIDPGPEPAWWHFIERPIWKKKKEFYDITSKKIEQLSTEFNRKKDDLRFLQANKAWWIDSIETANSGSKSLLKDIWNNYIRPVLHFFLILSIMLFSLNRFCRFVLIKEYLGVKRV